MRHPDYLMPDCTGRRVAQRCRSLACLRLSREGTYIPPKDGGTYAPPRRTRHPDYLMPNCTGRGELGPRLLTALNPWLPKFESLFRLYTLPLKSTL